MAEGCTKHDYKVVLAGMYGVGKTSIFRAMFGHQFCNGKPQSVTDFDTYYQFFPEQNMKIGLKIWDTVDMEKYDSISYSYYNGSHFVLLVYSVDSLTSLEKLEDIAKDALIHQPTAKLILVRNKIDLLGHGNGDISDDEDRFVSRLNSKIVARYCTSAKTGEGIKKLREELAKIALKLYISGGREPIDYESEPFKLYMQKESTEKQNKCCS